MNFNTQCILIYITEYTVTESLWHHVGRCDQTCHTDNSSAVILLEGSPRAVAVLGDAS